MFSFHRLCALSLGIFLLACLPSACAPAGAASAPQANLEEKCPPPSAEEASSLLEAAASVAEAAGPVQVSVEKGTVIRRAQTALPTSLYETPAPDSPLRDLEAGLELIVAETDDPLWYLASLEDGTAGYLYGEALRRISRDGSVASDSLFSQAAAERLEELEHKLPNGKYWNHMGLETKPGAETPFSITDTPCRHMEYGETYCNFYNGETVSMFPYDSLCQCLGFASFLSDQLFGKGAPFYVYHDPDLLRVGDHIRLRDYEHSVIVTEVTEKGVSLAEVNADYEDCLISWGRQLSRRELEGLLWDSEYISRYPLCPDGTDGFGLWPEDAAPKKKEAK